MSARLSCTDNYPSHVNGADRKVSFGVSYSIIRPVIIITGNTACSEFALIFYRPSFKK